MERLTLRGIWKLLMISRKKIFLAGIIFMIAVSPVIYLLAPAKYNIQTSISIPYEGVKVENYEILIRRSILKQVCRELKIDPSESSVAQIDHDLSIAIDEPKKMLYISYLGSDPALVTAIGNEISMQTLKFAREERIANQEDAIKTKEERLEYIDELMDDEFIAGYYDRIYREWRRLIREGDSVNLNVFLEVDPTIKNLYLEQKNLKNEIAKIEKEILNLREQDDRELEKHFSPIHEPRQKEPPRLILVIIASAVLGLLFGVLWVVVNNYGIKDIKKEGI